MDACRECGVGHHRIARGIVYPIGDHDHVAPVLIERRIGFRVSCVGGWIIDQLVNRYRVAGLLQPGLVGGEVIQRDKENPLAQCRSVDRPGESHPQPRLDVEPVELIDETELCAKAGLRVAIGQRQVDTPAGQLRRIRHSQKVRRERTDLRIRGIELDNNFAR